jgi:PAS domain-containing protein
VRTSSHGSRTGRFSFDVLTGKWDWDDEVFRIHGYQPGSVEPTTELVLERKHPGDRARVQALLDQVGREGGPFSISYRLVRVDGCERRVVLVGEGALCDPGDVTTIDGYYIDLTEDFAEESEEYAAAAVEASAENRAVIEQAKGALMLAYGLEADQAFSMLRWWSRNHNVKVRELSARLVVAAGSGEISDADLRGAIDAQLHDITAPDERAPQVS